MKLLRITEPGVIEAGDSEIPDLHHGEILLRLRYVGFCGSDLSTYLGKNPMVTYPRIPGHEISAEIEETGSGVPAGFTNGERVTVIPYTNCGTCSSCRNGRPNACQFNQTMGVQRDGAMQEYIAVPWEKVVKTGSLGWTETALVEPLTVGFHACARGRIKATDTVAVMGCGMIGAGAIIGAVSLGAQVIAIDIDDHKLGISRSLGASHVINSVNGDMHGELLSLTHDAGPDVIIEAAGNPVTYRSAVEEVAFSGRVVCIGYAAEEVAFATKLFVQKEMDILGSRNAEIDDFQAVISYLENEQFPLDKVITRTVDLPSAPGAIEKWAKEPGKVMKLLLKF